MCWDDDRGMHEASIGAFVSVKTDPVTAFDGVISEFTDDGFRLLNPYDACTICFDDVIGITVIVDSYTAITFCNTMEALRIQYGDEVLRIINPEKIEKGA